MLCEGVCGKGDGGGGVLDGVCWSRDEEMCIFFCDIEMYCFYLNTCAYMCLVYV